MCVFSHVWACVYVCMFMWARVYVCFHMCGYVHVCSFVCSHMLACVYVCSCVYVGILTCVGGCVFVYDRACAEASDFPLLPSTLFIQARSLTEPDTQELS